MPPVSPVEAPPAPEQPVAETRQPEQEKPTPEDKTESQIMEEKLQEIREMDTEVPEAQPVPAAPVSGPGRVSPSQYEERISAEKNGFFNKLSEGVRKIFRREGSDRELNQINANLERLENYCQNLFTDLDVPADVWAAKKEGVGEILGHMETQVHGNKAGSEELTRNLEQRLVNLKAALQSEEARQIWFKDRPGAAQASRLRLDDLVEAPPEISEEDIIEEEKVA